jgi:hypothetical protein
MGDPHGAGGGVERSPEPVHSMVIGDDHARASLVKVTRVDQARGPL